MTKLRSKDAELKDAVTRELGWDELVDVADIGVEVQAGIVTLSGTVNSWAKRVAATQAAHRVKGVRDVANEIEVRLVGASGHSDSEIARLVRHALLWDVFVPEEHITSTVQKGWVVLEGEVSTWAEHDAAARAVQNLAGVRGVTNKLTVTPAPASALQIREAIEAALGRRAFREAERIQLDVDDSTVTVRGVVESWPDKAAVLGAVRGTRGVSAVEDCVQVVQHGP